MIGSSNVVKKESNVRAQSGSVSRPHRARYLYIIFAFVSSIVIGTLAVYFGILSN